MPANGAEDLLELVRRRDLELIVAAVVGRLSGRQRRNIAAWRKRSPCMWSYFTSQTRSIRSGSHDKILAGAPAALAAGHARHLPPPAVGPLAPRMLVERVLAQRLRAPRASCLRIAIVNDEVTPT